MFVPPAVLLVRIRLSSTLCSSAKLNIPLSDLLVSFQGELESDAHLLQYGLISTLCASGFPSDVNDSVGSEKSQT